MIVILARLAATIIDLRSTPSPEGVKELDALACDLYDHVDPPGEGHWVDPAVLEAILRLSDHIEALNGFLVDCSPRDAIDFVTDAVPEFVMAAARVERAMVRQLPNAQSPEADHEPETVRPS